MRSITLIYLLICLILSSAAMAQEKKGEIRESQKKQVTHYLATYYTFHDRSDISDVRKIMTDYFLPAAAGVDWEVQIYYPLMTGSEYDMMILFFLHDGLATLEWSPTKKDIRFFEQLIKNVGDEEAHKVMDSLKKKIASERTEIIQRLHPKK